MQNNREVILAKQFNSAKGIKHDWPYEVIPITIREDNLCSSGLSPNLNLVESYEYLDGSPGVLKGVGDGTVAGQANWIFYTNLEDIFENKDARLYGTIIYPGTTFKEQDIEIQAGVYVWNQINNQYDRIESQSLGTLYTDGKILTGRGGPMRNMQQVTNSGFYLRKYVDPTPMTSARGVGSEVWWIRFRYGEVLLNAAEAAFELGFIEEALGYVNEVRERAGFPPNSLDANTLTFERLVNERKVELAFEDHRVWDLARWRLAHILWDGQPDTKSANIYALYPYRIVHPGSPNDGKYVFDKFIAPKFKAPRFYRMGNYYSEIPQNVLDANPLIIKNPFH